MEDMEEGPTTQGSTSTHTVLDNMSEGPKLHFEPEPYIFKEFGEIDADRRISFKEKMQKLTAPQIGKEPATSIINQIFVSFKLHSEQGHIEPYKDIKIREDKFDDWARRKTSLLGVNSKSFRNKYKKLYLYPKLHSLACHGLIDNDRIVERWQSIEPDLPDNLDNNLEEINGILDEYVPERRRQRGKKQIPLDTNPHSVTSNHSTVNKVDANRGKKRNRDEMYTSTSNEMPMPSSTSTDENVQDGLSSNTPTSSESNSMEIEEKTSTSSKGNDRELFRGRRTFTTEIKQFDVPTQRTDFYQEEILLELKEEDTVDKMVVEEDKDTTTRQDTTDEMVVEEDKDKDITSSATTSTRSIRKVTTTRTIKSTRAKSSLVSIHDRLLLENQESVIVLNGIGGIGKTALATEYIWRYKKDYDAIVVLNECDWQSHYYNNLYRLACQFFGYEEGQMKKRKEKESFFEKAPPSIKEFPHNKRPQASDRKRPEEGPRTNW